MPLSSCLLALIRISSTILNRNGESEHSSLACDPGENILAFITKYVTWWFSWIWFIQEVSLTCWIFIRKWCWILSNAFSVSIEITISFFSYVINYMQWFLHMNLIVHSWDKSQLVVINWYGFSKIGLKIFASRFIRMLAGSFLSW